MIEKLIKGKGSDEEMNGLNQTVTTVIQAYQDQTKFVQELVTQLPSELGNINQEYKSKIIETLNKIPLKIGKDG